MHIELHVLCRYYHQCEIQKEQRKHNARTTICIVNDDPEKTVKCKLIMNEHNIATLKH